MKRKTEPTTAKAAGMIGEELAKTGIEDKYRFTYAPGPPDESGRVEKYTLHVDPLPERLNRDWQDQHHYFTDESGTIYVELDRPATDDSEPLVPGIDFPN